MKAENRGDFDPIIGLLGRNGMAAREIARDLIALKPADRVKTTGEYAHLFRVGQGTVQKAFKVLEGTGAVKLETRGHLGTYIVERNLGLLWAVSGLGTVIVAMPLPNSSEFEGVATALADLFGRENIPLNLVHLPGSRRRIEQLQSDRADFVVLSQFSANVALAEKESLTTVMNCASGSYYARGSLTIIASPSTEDREDIRRVGIDEFSWDHTEITYMEFDPDSVELVEVPYHLIPRLVLEEEIDAAIWHKTTQRVEAFDRTLRFFDLEKGIGAPEIEDFSSLSVMVSEDNEAARVVFDSIVDADEVITIQKEVSEGGRIPMY